ncbi:MAG: outer membrane protein assembly factor BamA [Deltaproteobacteria bacterium]|nr:outer membrane protein assembly factor BamA [Deltaproteobacteria bacterium]
MRRALHHLSRRFSPAWGAALILALFSALAGAAAPAAAQDAAVLDFAVYASGDLSHLREQLPRQVAAYLSGEGVDAVLGLEGVDISAQEAAPERLAQAATEAGIGWVVWGSLSLFGESYSLDVRLLNASTADVEDYFAQGTGMETLTGSVSDVSARMAARMLGKVKVEQIVITGNKRIEADAVRRVMNTKEGQIYSPASVNRDIHAIFEMGYFEDIRVESEQVPGGVKLVYHVQEKPTIQKIEITGNRELDDAALREVLEISRGSIINSTKLEESVRKMEDLYREDNFHNVRISYDIVPVDENLASVVFNVSEGEKVLVKEIRILGNKEFSDKELRKLMKTKEKSFFSFITQAGGLNREDLSQDAARIGSYYHNHGYIQVKVSEPEVDFGPDGIIVTIKVEEGPQYRVGAVDVAGDLILPKHELLDRLSIIDQEIFSTEVMRKDQMVLTDIYADEGYAYTEIIPSTNVDAENRVVDITYTIDQGPRVYFERIVITGNTRTRDKVIRRELPLSEKGLYSGSALKRGIQNLARLDYFGDIQVDTLPGSEPDKMILKIEVEEKPTGSLTFGGGYSSVDNAFAMMTISQRNLLGRGQSLDFRAQVGGSSSRFSLSFTEPWFMDTRLSVGVDAYNWYRDYDTYNKTSRGGRLRLGYPLWDYTKVYGSYGYDVTEISDVDPAAAFTVLVMEGENSSSTVSASLVRDSRNRFFNPSRGSYNRVTVEVAGGPLGGDIAFAKYTGESGWYFPLFWGTVAFLHGEAGYVHEHSDGFLPVYERFFLGGINTLRGFEWEDLSPQDGISLIGGDKFVMANVEYIIPIVEEAGLVGVLFFDTGDVYDNDENIDLGNLRESAGFGFRWYSPIGPIRLERGYILDREPGESDGRWEFALGTVF